MKVEQDLNMVPLVLLQHCTAGDGRGDGWKHQTARKPSRQRRWWWWKSGEEGGGAGEGTYIKLLFFPPTKTLAMLYPSSHN